MRAINFRFYQFAFAGAMGIAFIAASPVKAEELSPCDPVKVQTAPCATVVQKAPVVQSDGGEGPCEKDSVDPRKRACAEYKQQVRMSEAQDEYGRKVAKIVRERDKDLAEIDKDEAEYKEKMRKEHEKLKREFDKRAGDIEKRRSRISNKINVAQTSPCASEKDYCKAVKEWNKLENGRVRDYNEDYSEEFAQFEAKYNKKMAEFEAKRNKKRAEAQKDIQEEYAKMGKPGFWSRVGGAIVSPFRWLGGRAVAGTKATGRVMVRMVSGRWCNCTTSESGVETCTPMSAQPLAGTEVINDPEMTTPKTGEVPGCGKTSSVCQEVAQSDRMVSSIQDKQAVDPTAASSGSSGYEMVDREAMGRAIGKAWGAPTVFGAGSGQ